jgi:hypothetical protein
MLGAKQVQMLVYTGRRAETVAKRLTGNGMITIVREAMDRDQQDYARLAPKQFQKDFRLPLTVKIVANTDDNEDTYFVAKLYTRYGKVLALVLNPRYATEVARKVRADCIMIGTVYVSGFAVVESQKQ